MFNSTNGILAVMKGTATRPRLGQRVFWFVCAVVCLLACSAAVSASERVTYLHTDNLGSVIAGTDASGNLLWREQYEPYGLKRLLPANAEGQRLWYTGHAHDDAMALSYFGARWYDPDAGRFLAVDPVDWVEERPMHSFNRYAYANNNPYKHVDPDGGFAIPVVIAVAIATADVVSRAIDAYKAGSSVFDTGISLGGASSAIGAAAVGVVDNVGKPGAGFFKRATKSESKEITKSSRKRVKRLIKNLSDNSRHNYGLSLEKTDQLRRIVEKAGGKLRNDGAAGVKGSSAGKPHVQTEGLGKSIDSRHIWTQGGVQ